MVQTSTSLPSDCSGHGLCYYVNATNQLQIARLLALSPFSFERVVFPGERLMFEAPPEAVLEIVLRQGSDTPETQQISCQELRVTESNTPDPTANDIDKDV